MDVLYNRKKRKGVFYLRFQLFFSDHPNDYHDVKRRRSRTIPTRMNFTFKRDTTSYVYKKYLQICLE